MLKRMSHQYHKKKVSYELVKDWLELENGIAVICCHVEKEEDIISSYSVPNYEFLCESFRLFLDKASELIPTDYSIELEISGAHFDDEQKQRIQAAIRNEYLLEAGRNHNDKIKNIYRILWFVFCFGLVTLFIWLFYDFSPFYLFTDILLVVLYFFGDRMMEFVISDGVTIRHQKVKTVQMMAMHVVFEENFEDVNLTLDEQREVKDKVLEVLNS